MKQEFLFDKKEELLDKLRSLTENGVKKKDITVISPFPVSEIDKILGSAPSNIKFFALSGAIIGFVTGFAFTIYTVLSWPIITGGKPIISIPAFIIIAFELTILFGALASLLGFFIFTRLPSIKNITSPLDYGNKFVILVDNKERIQGV